MITTWLLVIFAMTTHSVEIETVPYSFQEQCEQAAQRLNDTDDAAPMINAYCVPRS